MRHEESSLTTFGNWGALVNMKNAMRWAIAAFFVTLCFGFAAYYSTGFAESVLLSLMSTSLSLAVGLVIVNGFINEAERKKAAKVLASMVAVNVAEYHNRFIQLGHQKFGIPEWNGVIETMNQNKRNPDALSPQQRDVVVEILEENKDEIAANVTAIDDGFRELSYILGWNFHPKVTRDAISSRLEIAKLQTAISKIPIPEHEKRQAIEKFFDVDAEVTAVLNTLLEMTGADVADFHGDTP